MATTHSYDSEQRLVDIPFRRSGVCNLNAHMPANPNLVPPGYYMVFVVSRRGVPSVASWIDVQPAVRPAAPALKRGDIVVAPRAGLSGSTRAPVRRASSPRAAISATPRALPSIRTRTSWSSPTPASSSTWSRRVAPSTSCSTNGWLYQDVAVLPDGGFAVVNLPSAASSGVFRVDHDGEVSKINAGTHFGDGPTGIVLGKDGNLYVAELGARAVIRVDPETGAETVVSQGGHFASPSGIARSNDGHLLVVDHGSDKVIHVDPASGDQHVIASRGELHAPVDIAQDAEGKILIADMVGDKLIRIDPKTGVQTVIAQGGLLAGIRSIEVFGV